MKRISNFYLVGIVVGSVVLQLLAASLMSFWEDEAFTSSFASRGVEIVNQVQDWDVHPPLYLYLAAYWGRIFGFDEFGLRFLSILFSELTLFLTYLLAVSLYGQRTALFSAALLAFSPLFIMFGHNARYYSLAAFLALAVVYAMWQHSQTRKPFFLLLFVLAGIAFIYVLFAGLVVIGVCAIWWLVDWSRRQQRSLLDAFSWLMANAAVVIGAYPVLRNLGSIASRTPAEFETSMGWLDVVKRLVYSLYVFGLGETISPLNPLAWIGVIVILGIAVFAVRHHWRQPYFWLPVALFISILMIGVMTTFQPLVSMTWQNLPSRAFYGLPFLSIWLASGLVEVPQFYKRITIACLLVVFGFGIINYFTRQQYLRPIFSVPWRSVFNEIARTAQNDAIVICGEGDSSCTFYSNLFGFGGLSYADWSSVSEEEFKELWWIQTHLSRSIASKADEEQIITQMSSRFYAHTLTGYGRQDPGIRRLKTRLLGQDDYEYRTVVHRFYNP